MSGTATALIIIILLLTVLLVIIVTILVIFFKKKQLRQSDYHVYETVDGPPLLRMLSLARNVRPEVKCQWSINRAYVKERAKTMPAKISLPVTDATYEEPGVGCERERSVTSTLQPYYVKADVEDHEENQPHKMSSESDVKGKDGYEKASGDEYEAMSNPPHETEQVIDMEDEDGHMNADEDYEVVERNPPYQTSPVEQESDHDCGDNEIMKENVSDVANEDGTDCKDHEVMKENLPHGTSPVEQESYMEDKD